MAGTSPEASGLICPKDSLLIFVIKNLNIIFGINRAFALNFDPPLVPYTPQNL